MTHGAIARVQSRLDLCVATTLEFAHHECLTLALWKIRQRADDHAEVFAPLERIPVAGGLARILVDDGGPRGAGAQKVERAVMGDRAQPRPNAVHGLSAGERQVGAQKGLLYSLLSVGMTDQLGAMREERSAVAENQDRERRVDPLSAEPCQPLVAQRVRSSAR